VIPTPLSSIPQNHVHRCGIKRSDATKAFTALGTAPAPRESARKLLPPAPLFASPSLLRLCLPANCCETVTSVEEECIAEICISSSDTFTHPDGGTSPATCNQYYCNAGNGLIDMARLAGNLHAHQILRRAAAATSKLSTGSPPARHLPPSRALLRRKGVVSLFGSTVRCGLPHPLWTPHRYQTSQTTYSCLCLGIR
jgi:hypothetical protein